MTSLLLATVLSWLSAAPVPEGVEILIPESRE